MKYRNKEDGNNSKKHYQVEEGKASLNKILQYSNQIQE